MLIEDHSVEILWIRFQMFIKKGDKNKNHSHIINFVHVVIFYQSLYIPLIWFHKLIIIIKIINFSLHQQNAYSDLPI